MIKTLFLRLLIAPDSKRHLYRFQFISLSVLCFLLSSCGKRVEQLPLEESVSRPELSAQLIILKAKLLTNGDVIEQAHTFNKDSEVAIPEVIKISNSEAGDQVARLYFNVNTEATDTEEEFSFYCNYAKSIDELADKNFYYFESCFVEEGNQREISYYPGNEPIIYNGNSIVFKLLSLSAENPSFDVEAISEIEIDGR